MHALKPHRYATESESMVFGPAARIRGWSRQCRTVHRGAVYRPGSGNDAIPDAAGTGGSGTSDRSDQGNRARSISGILGGFLILLGVLAVAVPAQAQSTSVPSAPQDLTATPTTGRVVVEWSVPSDDGGSELLRYEIRSAKGASVPDSTRWRETLLNRTYVYGGLDDGKLYTFEVRAVNAHGAGPAVQVRATPGGVPGEPHGLSASPGDSQVVLNWSAPENDFGFAVTRYELRHDEGASVANHRAWISPGLVTTHTVSGLTNGTQYAFEVRAVNARGLGPAAEVQATPVTAPSAPQDFTATPMTGRVDLEWSAPSDDGGSELLRYEIRSAKGESVPDSTRWKTTSLNGKYGYGTLDNDELYTFEVRAVNAHGAGPAAQVQATPGGAPTEPEDLSATPGDRQVVLNWSAPENDSGFAVTGYEFRHGKGASVANHRAWASAGLVTTHTVSGLTNGTQYAFEVRAVNVRGGGPAAEVQATPVTAPSAPQDLTATPTTGRIDLAWSEPTDDGGFELLRYEIRSASGESVPDSTRWHELALNRTYYSAGLENGELYTFEVRAVNAHGAGPPAQVQATPGGLPTPTEPEGLSAAPGDTQVVLSWSAPKRDGGSAVTGYEFRHAEGASVPVDTSWTTVGLVTTHTVFGLTNRTQYAFEVRAVNARGPGPAAEVQATPLTTPSAPRSLLTTSSAGRIGVVWSAPSDDGGSELLRYEIRSASGESVPDSTRWYELALNRTYYSAGLENGELYTFEVRAVNAQGPGPAAEVQATPGGAPTKPRTLSATPGNERAVLRWSAPANDGGSTVTGYEVRNAEGASVPVDTSWTTVGLVTTHTVSGLTNETQYTFEVRAVNARGPGPAAEVQATPLTTPSAPRSLLTTSSAGRIGVVWSAPSDDGGSELLRYEIRHAKGASVPDDTGWTELGLSLAHIYGNVNNNELYTFQVRAVNAQGPGPFAEIQATSDGAPTMPRTLSATPGNERAVLSWSAPANDGGSTVTGYEVRNAEGASVPGNTSWTPVGDVTTHTVSGLTNGTQYAFEVRAVNAHGAGPAAEVQATPVAVPSAPQDLTATPTTGRIDLAWSVPADEGGSELLRYEIRGASGESVPDDTRWAGILLLRTFVYPSLQDGRLYTFQVRAVNAHGAGPAAQVQATPGGAPTPTEPEGLSAAPGGTQVVLNWSAPKRDGGSAVTGYEFRHAEGADVLVDTSWTTVGLVTTHTVSGLTNGTQYTFEVRAVNARGPGPAAEVQATPLTTPSAPRSLLTTSSAGRIGVVWSAPSDDGGSELLRYEIRHAKGASVPDDTGWTELGLSLAHIYGNVNNNELYTFQVRAVNAQGPGPFAEIQATSDGAPTMPRTLSATPGNERAVLSWSAPANDGGSTVTGYEVRNAEGASVPGNTSWTPVGDVTTHTVSGLTNGTQYAFEVRAVNAHGAGPAAEVKATPANVPSEPQSFTATSTNGRVELSWSAPNDDGGSELLLLHPT